MTKVIEVLAPATLRWNTTRSPLKAEGSQGGKAAISGEIQYVRRDGVSEVLDLRGERKIEAGDQIIIHSSGGGGFGAPA
jgi:N-methylhydantoinase B/oxoprolinase/acetone carboxylase alpha subunit